MSTNTRNTRELVDSVPVWWHTMDLGGGVVTKGMSSAEHQRDTLAALDLSLKGKSVLDINCWDGFFSFEAERRGARSVRSLDYFVWSMDLVEHVRHLTECRAKKVVPAPYQTMPYFQRDKLPGKRGFDVAHELLQSKVEPMVADFMTADLEAIGKHDVVLFLGSLYHMRHPLLALERLCAVTTELAAIETEAVEVSGQGNHALCEFFEGDLNGDSSNWWSPNLRALVGMCRAAGFRDVEVKRGPPRCARASGHKLARLLPVAFGRGLYRRYRAIVVARP